jgi:hypothetical protein
MTSSVMAVAQTASLKKTSRFSPALFEFGFFCTLHWMQ